MDTYNYINNLSLEQKNRLKAQYEKLLAIENEDLKGVQCPQMVPVWERGLEMVN